MSNLQLYIIRQNELKKIMASSDAYASKCLKLGLPFKETYPTKYEEYVKANEEYNKNQLDMIPLQEEARIEEEKRILKLRQDLCNKRNSSGKYPNLTFIVRDETTK